MLEGLIIIDCGSGLVTSPTSEQMESYLYSEFIKSLAMLPNQDPLE